MTPKEKANEIYTKMYNMVYTAHYTAKQCALVAVDEIIDKDGYNNDYWKEVKQELYQLPDKIY